MSGMLLACSMLMSDASLSWERPTDPPGRPAKPWKRLCSPVKQNPDWGFLVFIPRHCEIHRFEKRPRSAGSWELATGIVYKWGAKYAHPPKKYLLCRFLHTAKKRGNERLEERRSLLCLVTEWWLTAGWNGHCMGGHLLQRTDKGGSRLCIRPWPFGNPLMAPSY